jgi:fructuronate reductase
MFNYDRSKVEIGILHFGLGGFHRAHQAVFIDKAIENGHLDLGIASVSQRDPSLADEMKSADSIYEVEASDGLTHEKKSIGSIKESLFYSRDEARILEIARSPKLKAITLTVTEKAYKSDSEFAARLAKVLKERYESGGGSIAVISCDNLPSNGNFTKNLMKEIIKDQNLWNWVEANIRFPNSMVDRIVPAPANENRLLIKTEIFNQWVIENDPISKYLEGAGVQFVEDVKPYELAKIRLFNGIHSYLAYFGEIHGIEFISDVIKIPSLNKYVEDMQKNEIAKTLKTNFDLNQYSEQIRNRMANQTLRHRSRQIAMDGSQKMPQRMIGTLNDLANLELPAPNLINALSTWIKYLRESKEINDPIADKLKTLTLAENYQELFTLLSNPLNPIYFKEITNIPLTFSL